MEKKLNILSADFFTYGHVYKMFIKKTDYK